MPSDLAGQIGNFLIFSFNQRPSNDLPAPSSPESSASPTYYKLIQTTCGYNLNNLCLPS